MNPIDFVRAYYPAAKASEQATGINAVFSLAQAALESAWGAHAPGFAFFGIKDVDGLNGNEQLLPTIEYSRYPHLTPAQVGLATIDRIEWNEAAKQFIYHGKSYFRKYANAAESFEDHGKLFFKRNKAGARPYEIALSHVNDPEAFVRLIGPIYASGPNYADIVISIMRSINKIITQYSLSI